MGRRVVLTSVGSYGDLHPFIAVALALRARGDHPVVATLEEYRTKVEAEGLTFRPVRPSMAQILERSGLTPGEIARRTMRGSTTFLVDTLITPYLEESYADLLEICAEADVVCVSSFAFAGMAAAEARRRPVVTLLLSPLLFFSTLDPPVLKETPGAGLAARMFGRPGAAAVMASMRLGARLLWQPTRRLRRRVGLPPVRGSELLDLPLRSDAVIGLWSPALAPLPADAPPQASLAGFTFYDSETGGTPPADPELEAFLAAGPPPLVFTLGSFAVQAPGGFYGDSARAARAMGRRAVLLTGADAPCPPGLAGPDVHVAAYAPHSTLFPRAAAVIHHGGIGTTAQALRAGVPQLVCPALGDQPDNARRLVRAGVARQLPLARYTADRAVRALEPLMGDAAARGRAAELSAAVAREDGAAAAAEIIAAVAAG